MPRPTGERSAYHHGQLRSALIATATEQSRVGGPEAVVLREAARRLGVSPAAAYRHFRDRDALLLAVRTRALALLAQRMREEDARSVAKSASPADSALGRFRALGRAYVAFAVTDPGLFRALNIAPGAGTQPPALPPDGDPFHLLVDALDRLVDTGVLQAKDRVNADAVAWAAVHGLSVLLLDGLLPRSDIGNPPPKDDGNGDALLDRLLDVIALGLLPRT